MVAGDAATDLPLHQPSRLSSPPSLDIVTINSASFREATVAPSEGEGPPALAALVESWLPITESRNGSIYSAVFHLVCSGIGFQALLLPVAFTVLGWAGGTICLLVAFAWQLYTIWLLVQLHESIPGTRHSRFLRLSMAAFGLKLGKLAAIFPVMYLSGGSCVMLIITGGGALEQLNKVLCWGVSGCEARALTGTQWFLVFACVAVAMAQLPNLNSLAKVSFLGSLAGIAYLTFLWVLSLTHGRPDGVSYNTSEVAKTGMPGYGNISFAITALVLAFRGHNVILEIQGTLPSSAKKPASETMWRAVVISYIVIAAIFFPLAICGYWAYGNTLPRSGILGAFKEFHGHDSSKHVTGLIHVLLIISCLSSFPIYAMPVFDNLELIYVSKKKQRCSRWARACLRCFFGAFTFFVAVAIPFLPKLGFLIGGLALPLTFSYPCLMWNSIKQPPGRRSPMWMWCINLLLGCTAIILSVLMIAGAAWNLGDKGLRANFFKP